jgi:hypothetical protein
MGADRAKPGTERFFGKEAHQQGQHESNQCCRMAQIKSTTMRMVLLDFLENSACD